MEGARSEIVGGGDEWRCIARMFCVHLLIL